MEFFSRNYQGNVKYFNAISNLFLKGEWYCGVEMYHGEKPLIEAKRILEKIEGRIKGHNILNEIYKKGDGKYTDLIEKYGEDNVLNGVNLIEIYKMLYEITNI
jgi:hypothetical protein